MKTKISVEDALNQKAESKGQTNKSIMSDIENLDVMIGSYQRDNCEVQEEYVVNETDLRSNRHDRELNQIDSKFRSYLNNNLEKSGSTEETNVAFNSEKSSQVFRQLGELKSDINAQISEVINPAIAEKVLLSIENALNPTKSNPNANWDHQSDKQSSQVAQQRDFQSDELHPQKNDQTAQQSDLRSDGLHPHESGEIAQRYDARS